VLLPHVCITAFSALDNRSSDARSASLSATNATGAHAPDRFGTTGNDVCTTTTRQRCFSRWECERTTHPDASVRRIETRSARLYLGTHKAEGCETLEQELLRKADHIGMIKRSRSARVKCVMSRMRKGSLSAFDVCMYLLDHPYISFLSASFWHKAFC
jgi:hypothetical protein